MWAILIALLIPPDKSEVVIYSDCLAAISAINSFRNPHTTDRQRLKMKGYNIIRRITKQEQRLTKLVLHWVKGHNKEQGNEIADALAKLGTLKPYPGIKAHDTYMPRFCVRRGNSPVLGDILRECRRIGNTKISETWKC